MVPSNVVLLISVIVADLERSSSRAVSAHGGRVTLGSPTATSVPGSDFLTDRVGGYGGGGRRVMPDAASCGVAHLVTVVERDGVGVAGLCCHAAWVPVVLASVVTVDPLVNAVRSGRTAAAALESGDWDV